jgi:hypothetical protein
LYLLVWFAVKGASDEVPNRTRPLAKAANLQALERMAVEQNVSGHRSAQPRNSQAQAEFREEDFQESK